MKYIMNNLKSSIKFGLFFLCILGSTQAFAENVKVKIGKIDKNTELIIFSDFDNTEKAEHSPYCNFDDTREVPAYIRLNGSKIQPVCWAPGKSTSVLTPIGESIHFLSEAVEFKEVVFDIDKKKIR